jgi:hypothetical protein
MSIRGVGVERVLGLLGLLLASGCADRFLYTPLLPPPRPMVRRPAAAVELLVVTPPARPHTNVGLMQEVAGSNRWDESATEMIGNLRERAGALGCDAVLIMAIDRRIGQHHAQSVQASCIVYNDAAPVSSSYK